MFGFSDYILNNYVLIFEIIGLLLLSFISVHISHEAKQMTRIAVIILFVESIVFIIDFLISASKASISPIILILELFSLAVFASFTR